MGKTLREARQLLGLTQQELETKTGVSQQTISNLETGYVKRPAYDNVIRLVRYFHKRGLAGVTADSLLGRHEERRSA